MSTLTASQFELILPVLRAAGFLVVYSHDEREQSADATRAAHRLVDMGVVEAEAVDSVAEVLKHSTWQTIPPVGLSAVANSDGSSVTRLHKAALF